MSIIEPKIDVLLDKTDNDRFLLCALASKRAHDINDMMRGQRDRAIQLQTAVEIARAADKKPLSLAFGEVARGEVSYDPASIDVKNHESSEFRWPCGQRNLPTPRNPEAPDSPSQTFFASRSAFPLRSILERSAFKRAHKMGMDMPQAYAPRQSRALRGFSLTH